ncbi:uncharacterized protein LOC127798920 isoform X2 [Diospyros lotus]|uniref:uncharacterized protein LOC127798920 isoform X2 n=1 Tax=Diospyros lotus TaxID=55363 RepID=UPI002256FD65|nr:uncharacterized protein LOC127798920 isoform X2 [Diospyros lotus]
MELFRKAKTIRLRSHRETYLLAEEDQESVCQDRQGLSKRAEWTVEFVDGFDAVVRLKSCYGKYLTAADEQFLLGVTGRKVTQSLPRKLDSQVEWEPVREGFQVRLKTRYGNYLRANGGLPPWRNSITHDVPFRHMDWILWEVDIVELRPEAYAPEPGSMPLARSDSASSFHLRSKLEPGDCLAKPEGRIIYYSVVEDEDKIEEERESGDEPYSSFRFRGHGLEELTEKLEEETGLEDVIVCSRNPLTGKLYPLRSDLPLPPNNADMHLVLVPPSSTVGRELAPETPTST